jgi:hypothetical protein
MVDMTVKHPIPPRGSETPSLVAATYLDPRPISKTACCANRTNHVDVVFRVTITAGSKPVDPSGGL